MANDPTDDLQLMRAGLDAYALAVGAPEPVDEVRDDVVVLPGRTIPVRVYLPAGAEDTLVWFHGGGYVAGSLDAIDPVCRALAVRAGCRVVSVGYRLAPEHPFPAALEDCLDVLDRVSPGAGRLALGGDSAGGGLAAATARRTQVPVAALLLLCPFLDLTLRSPSVHSQADEGSLTLAELRSFVRMYLGRGGNAEDPDASPLFADPVGLPPVIVVTAGRDPLRDEGERYAEQVAAAGGVVRARRWEHMLHGFVGATASLPEAREALQWSAEQLRELLADQAGRTA